MYCLEAFSFNDFFHSGSRARPLQAIQAEPGVGLGTCYSFALYSYFMEIG